ncbi:hypothetical protein HXX76_003441 [Chlamydomonas incerta]|uniref:Uncharacterized protein n=1 Tax=Chlamydomonas incerta TaxID=51695 RepID=A0A835TAY4_CHLIN|nr:hypothetical protein HXX76_003441 [Chlamydomonas incerta]|eukprot:KAG2441833.1 hypothetical protein HXX76_003441 [Chlamydomonas incerta]
MPMSTIYVANSIYTEDCSTGSDKNVLLQPVGVDNLYVVRQNSDTSRCMAATNTTPTSFTPQVLPCDPASDSQKFFINRTTGGGWTLSPRVRGSYALKALDSFSPSNTSVEAMGLTVYFAWALKLPFTPVNTPVCSRPDSWCASPSAYLYGPVDCDGDGILDWACRLPDPYGGGELRWALRSAEDCNFNNGFAFGAFDSTGGTGVPDSACPAAFTVALPTLQPPSPQPSSPPSPFPPSPRPPSPAPPSPPAGLQVITTPDGTLCIRYDGTLTNLYDCTAGVLDIQYALVQPGDLSSTAVDSQPQGPPHTLLGALPFAPAQARVCSLPAAWCALTSQQLIGPLDCNGDGVLDWACVSPSTSQRWLLQSTTDAATSCSATSPTALGAAANPPTGGTSLPVSACPPAFNPLPPSPPLLPSPAPSPFSPPSPAPPKPPSPAPPSPSDGYSPVCYDNMNPIGVQLNSTLTSSESACRELCKLVGFTCADDGWAWSDSTNSSGRVLAIVPGVSTYAACLALCDENSACRFATSDSNSGGVVCYLATNWVGSGRYSSTCLDDADIAGFHLSALNGVSWPSGCSAACLANPDCTYFVRLANGTCSIRWRFLDTSPGSVGSTAPFRYNATSCFLRSTIGAYLCSTPGAAVALNAGSFQLYNGVSRQFCENYCSPQASCRLFTWDQQVVGSGLGACQASGSWDYSSLYLTVASGGQDNTCVKVYT